MTCVCNEELCACEGNVGVDQLRRSQRIQEEQEEEDREHGIDMCTYHVVKVAGEEELSNIIGQIVTYYMEVTMELSSMLGYEVCGEECCKKIRTWSNPLPPYTHLNEEDIQVFWVAFPALTTDLEGLLRTNGLFPEQFNYDKHVGRLFFCTDNTCVYSEDHGMCPTCIRRCEDLEERELDET